MVYNSSARTLKLVQHPFKSAFGKRSFSRVGPRMWNLLPENIREQFDTDKFKSALKAFLFGNERLVAKLYEV